MCYEFFIIDLTQHALEVPASIHTTALSAPAFYSCTPTLHNGKESTVRTRQKVKTEPFEGIEAAGGCRRVSTRAIKTSTFTKRRAYNC